jgi:hypothetical protein
MMQETSVGKLQKTGISYNYLLPINSGLSKDVIDKYQMYNALKGRGSQEDLMNFLSNVSNEEAAVFDLFDKHLNTAMNSIGMTKENGWNDNQIQQASEYISQAWYNAIAPTQYKQMQDSYGMSRALEGYKRRNTPSKPPQRLTSPYAVLTPKEIQTKNISNKYKGTIEKVDNGKIIYSQNALQNPGYKKYKEYNKEINDLRKERENPHKGVYGKGLHAYDNAINNKIKNLIKERDALLNDPTYKQGALLGELDNDPRLRATVAKHFIADFDENNYDAYGNVGIQLNITDGDILKNVQNTLGDEVHIFKKAQQSNSGNIIFEDTKKTINPSELDWKQATLISINNSTVFRTKDKDGKDIYLDASNILNSQGNNANDIYNEAVTDRSILAEAKASGITEVKGEDGEVKDIDVLIEEQQQIIDALTAKYFVNIKIDDVNYKL